MKLLSLFLFPFKWLLKGFKKIRRRYILAKAASKMELVVKEQVVERKQLRKDTNAFLRDYFGIDARSNFIPPDFKNAEEVRVAILNKFQPRMDALNVNYTDLYL